jgi:site-specific DNA recombinase
VIWYDVTSFLKHPKTALKKLTVKDSEPSLSKELKHLESNLVGKEKERTAIVSLYRRGKITESDLDNQLQEINAEESALKDRRKVIRTQIDDMDLYKQGLNDAEVLLRSMKELLCGEVSFEVKRKLIEVLIEKIAVNTIFDEDGKHAEVHVHYRFANVSFYTTVNH